MRRRRIVALFVIAAAPLACDAVGGGGSDAGDAATEAGADSSARDRRAAAGTPSEDSADLPIGITADAPTSTERYDPALAVEDATGRTVVLERPPRRIVSLVPSVSRIVLELGARDRLVARTDFDDDPALQDLPSVGGGLHPSLERLASLAPDLVVRFAGESDVETPERLDDLGIPHVAVRPDGIADVRAIVRQMGRILGAGTRADALLDGLDAELAAVRLATRDRPRVRAAFLLGGTPPWVAGPGTFIDELIVLAGGVNAFGDLERLYAPVSPEVLRAREVDVVLTGPGTAVDRALVGSARVERLPGAVELPGVDLGEAARAVARALHPGALR